MLNMHRFNMNCIQDLNEKRAIFIHQTIQSFSLQHTQKKHAQKKTTRTHKNTKQYLKTSSVQRLRKGQRKSLKKTTTRRTSWCLLRRGQWPRRSERSHPDWSLVEVCVFFGVCLCIFYKLQIFVSSILTCILSMKNNKNKITETSIT